MSPSEEPRASVAKEDPPMAVPYRALVLAALGLVASVEVGLRQASADDAVPFAQAEADVTLLSTHLKDAKWANEDLVGSMAAIEAAFFRLDPGVRPEDVKAWQGRALDHLFRALTLVRYEPRTKENVR